MKLFPGQCRLTWDYCTDIRNIVNIIRRYSFYLLANIRFYAIQHPLMPLILVRSWFGFSIPDVMA